MTNTITTPTPHIGAKKGDFAKTVLMSGDPLRAKYIAEHFLTNAIEVTNIRGMLGFTGEYKGARISIMGHGMGIPSAAIYVTELFLGYGVEAIIRAGSCGAIRPDVNVNDIVIALGASTDSNINRIHFNGYDFAAIADYELLNKLVTTAQNQTNTKIHVGNLFSTDIFYTPESKILDILEGQGILGVDMEAAGIYGLAAKHGKKAATICTVSDHIRKQEYLNAKERQTGFTTMIEIALESAVTL